MAKYLCQDDPYKKEFEANITQQTKTIEGYEIVLDRTWFFPGGGGQEPDQGTVDGQELLALVLRDGEIFHKVAKEISSQEVRCEIDWDGRFTMMQQHTGEHILAQCLHRSWGAETLSSNVSYDLGRKAIPADKVKWGEFAQIEDMANEIVEQDRPVQALWLGESEFSQMPLRKQPKEKFLQNGKIRVVQIEDFDLIPCGGTHCARTGEVGTIKIVRTEKDGDRVWLDFCCGRAARRDHEKLNSTAVEFGKVLSVGRLDLKPAFEKVLADKDAMEKLLAEQKEQLAQVFAQTLLSEAPNVGSVRVIKKVITARADELQTLGKELIKQQNLVVLLGSSIDNALLLFACSRDLDLDMSAVLQECAPLIQGGGGGSPHLAQAGGKNKEGVALALDKAYELIKQRI